jgi:hypothetical protein
MAQTETRVRAKLQTKQSINTHWTRKSRKCNEIGTRRRIRTLRYSISHTDTTKGRYQEITADYKGAAGNTQTRRDVHNHGTLSQEGGGGEELYSSQDEERRANVASACNRCTGKMMS